MAVLLDRLGLQAPRSLIRLWRDPPAAVEPLLYWREDDPEAEQSVLSALDAMDEGAQEPPEHLLPIFAVDERSFAVVVCAVRDTGEQPANFGWVLRWHLNDVPTEHQAAPLDSDAYLYAESLGVELAARAAGLQRSQTLAEQYKARFTDQQVVPKAWVVRPMQLACQNVIIGLGALASDSDIDGERVELWQTCEAPHLATHEANRALAAVTLCDAFQNGGTMEVRFDGSRRRDRAGNLLHKPHPEGRVPASLQRFARSRGFELGRNDPAAISPSEARQLFLAVTPMNDSLRSRVDTAIARGVASPERFCFTLLMPVWRDIELDFLLGCSARVSSILFGGAEPWQRTSRMAESEACRAALLAGMYFRRVDSGDAAAGQEVRTYEDKRRGVAWTLLPDDGAVRFSGLPAEPLPWSDGGTTPSNGTVVVLPRAHPTNADFAAADSLGRRYGCPAVVVTTADSVIPPKAGRKALRAPDRLGVLDLEIEGRLTKARGVRV